MPTQKTPAFRNGRRSCCARCAAGVWCCREAAAEQPSAADEQMNDALADAAFGGRAEAVFQAANDDDDNDEDEIEQPVPPRVPPGARERL